MNPYKKVLLAYAIAAALASTSPAMAQQRKFEVSAQPAVTAIPELARQAQVQIIAPAGSLEGIHTPAIVGEMDARKALRMLLEGTGLEIKSDEGNVILLQKTGTAPTRSPSEQAIGSGVVRGRVLNTATGEYVRNAEIRVEGTQIVTYSEDGGDFRLTGVPTGEVTVVAKYTGLQESRAVANVVSGQVAALDFELKVPSYAAPGSNGDAVEMDMLMVTAKREGQASAIMERRAAMNAKNVVAADNYGALTMGDVGEFMKSMPGISLDYTEVDATAVRIGGPASAVLDQAFALGEVHQLARGELELVRQTLSFGPLALRPLQAVRRLAEVLVLEQPANQLGARILQLIEPLATPRHDRHDRYAEPRAELLGLLGENGWFRCAIFADELDLLTHHAACTVDLLNGEVDGRPAASHA